LTLEKKVLDCFTELTPGQHFNVVMLTNLLRLKKADYKLGDLSSVLTEMVKRGYIKMNLLYATPETVFDSCGFKIDFVLLSARERNREQ